MKNIYVIPTDKPSRLYEFGGELILTNEPAAAFRNQHIYITNDEEIKVNDYITDGYLVWKWKDDSSLLGRKKVITTTDQDLIKDGVQTIDDDFLEWFVKNPSCEVVEVIKEDIEQPKPLYSNGNHKGERVWIETYKIIIPKEEPCDNCNNDICCCIIKEEHKQETLEEAAERLFKEFQIENPIVPNKDIRPFKLGFIQGAKWQQERMYSDMQEYAEFCIRCYEKGLPCIIAKDWFEQFKKK